MVELDESIEALDAAIDYKNDILLVFSISMISNSNNLLSNFLWLIKIRDWY